MSIMHDNSRIHQDMSASQDITRIDQDISTQYDDIIGMSHHVSEKHIQMSMKNRAAQFAPFAALTGYESAIKETARVTDEFIELDDSSKEILDFKLQILQDNIENQPQVTIIYFRSDDKKEGGKYITCNNIIKKIDIYKKAIIMLDETVIQIPMIIDIKGDIFKL